MRSNFPSLQHFAIYTEGTGMNKQLNPKPFSRNSCRFLPSRSNNDDETIHCDSRETVVNFNDCNHKACGIKIVKLKLTFFIILFSCL